MIFQTKKIINKILRILGIILLCTSSINALETDTHEGINEYIARNTLNVFSLDSYLKNQLGIQNGVDEIVNSQKVWQWLRDGGLKEDIPAWHLKYLRSVNHFHNPITKTGFSGIFFGKVLSGDSTIGWAQRAIETQSPGGYYSWFDVRDYYYKALRLSSKTDRDTNFASTFRGLGQLMHLVQDMSVPAHTRDDGHAKYDYEGWVKDAQGSQDLQQRAVFDNALSNPVFFGTIALKETSVFTNTPVPIANLFDTSQYIGNNPGVTANLAIDSNGKQYSNIGLSEYTNANFFSEDTINDSNFPYPLTQDMPVIPKDFYNEYWDTTYPRQYYQKNCCGETNGGQGYILAAVDFLDYYREKYPLLSFTLPKRPVLDSNVYEDYAKLLLPRAVGYSAGLLNYFFRGDITLDFDFDAGYGYVILNNTQEEMEGMFEVYYDDIYDQRQLLWSGDLFIRGNNKSTTISFTTPAFPKEPDKYILVFSGRIGSEYNAVAGKVVVMPDMEMRSAHFIVFRDWDSRIRDNQTGQFKYPSMIGWPFFYPKFEESGDDRSGYYDTQSILMVTYEKKSVPADWGYPDDTMYYWKFRNVSGQAKLVQEGTEPGDRRLYHKAVVNVDGRSFTVNKIERSQYYENFITHSTYGNDYGFVYHTDDPLNEKYVDDGYDAVVGQCDSSSIFMNIYWSPRRYLTPPVVNAIYLYNSEVYVWIGALDNEWFYRKTIWGEDDTWRALSSEELTADVVEIYSAHAPMYPPEPF